MTQYQKMLRQLFSNAASCCGHKRMLAVTTIVLILTCVAMTFFAAVGSDPALIRLQTSAVPTQHTETYPSSPQSDSHSQGLKYHGYKSNEDFKIPFMGNYNCSDAMCTEFLSSHYLYRCKLENKHHPPLVDLKGSCHFMNGTNRAPVALASFQGSGNTWVRGLLEQATGICTGALYCDRNLRHSGFNGEGYRNGAVIVVKTHSRSWSDYVYSTTRTTTNSDHYHNRTKKYHHAKRVEIEDGPPWGSAILILRNPRDALVAEWSRRLTLVRTYLKHTHVQEFGSEYFGDKIEWAEFTKLYIKVWESYFDGWVLSGIKRDLLVVKYEDLKKDTINEAERMLMFLKVPFSREDLKKRLSEDFERFHRPHPKEFEHFTPEQEKHVHERVESVVALLKRENIGDTLGVEEYLEPSV